MTGGSYFAADRRTVTKEGVDHVMAVFFGSCCETAAVAASGDEEASRQNLAKVICDEEMLAG